MSECPYEKNFIDEDIDAEVVNEKYIAWHEGFVACEKDLASWANELGKQLEEEIRKTKQLQVELIAKYYEDRNKPLAK